MEGCQPTDRDVINHNTTHPTHPTQHNVSNTQRSDAAMDRDVINQETRDNANSTQRRIQQERTEVL